MECQPAPRPATSAEPRHRTCRPSPSDPSQGERDMALSADVKELAARVRNWGRWGDDDEIGTLNLLTGDVVAAAAGEIKTGRRLAPGIPMDEQGPQTGTIPGRDHPAHELIMVDTPRTGDPS